jgi:hypothetical protein
MKGKTYIKFFRSGSTLKLLKDPKLFALFTLIAIRARRTDEVCLEDLNMGEAFLGDHEVVGLSRQEYRTRIEKLRKLGLITYRTTHNGTIATIINKDIYDINIKYKNHEINQQATGRQPSGNQQLTGNKNEKNEKNEIKMNNNKNSKKNGFKEYDTKTGKNRFKFEKEPDYRPQF